VTFRDRATATATILLLNAGKARRRLHARWHAGPRDGPSQAARRSGPSGVEGWDRPLLLTGSPGWPARPVGHMVPARVSLTWQPLDVRRGLLGLGQWVRTGCSCCWRWRMVAADRWVLGAVGGPATSAVVRRRPGRCLGRGVRWRRAAPGRGAWFICTYSQCVASESRRLTTSRRGPGAPDGNRDHRAGPGPGEQVAGRHPSGEVGSRLLIASAGPAGRSGQD
jgi:hypothetical protein